MTASQEHNRQLARALRDGDGCVPEADSALNDSARAVIAEMRAQHGVAWLGDVNQRDHALPVWLWDGATVCNFGADFVLPVFDAELERLIVGYRARDWKNIADRDWIARRIVDIFDRVKLLGGTVLVWS